MGSRVGSTRQWGRQMTILLLSFLGLYFPMDEMGIQSPKGHAPGELPVDPLVRKTTHIGAGARDGGAEAADGRVEALRPRESSSLLLPSSFLTPGTLNTWA